MRPAAVEGKEISQPPFPQRIHAPPLPEGLTWLNTAGPLELADLRGKFVLMDFWTFCCINCMHILPELAQAGTRLSQRAGGDRRPLGQVRHGKGEPEHRRRDPPLPHQAPGDQRRRPSRLGPLRGPGLADPAAHRPGRLYRLGPQRRDDGRAGRGGLEAGPALLSAEGARGPTPLRFDIEVAARRAHAAAVPRQDPGRPGRRASASGRQRPQPDRRRAA